MNQSFEEYFRCPRRFANFALGGVLDETRGYFRFGADTICFGRTTKQNFAATPTQPLFDAARETVMNDGTTYLPFDIEDAVNGLRYEKYVSSAYGEESIKQSAVQSLYYQLRPLLPVSIRKHLQRLHLNGWDLISFPRWPLDGSVDDLFRVLMLCSLKTQELTRIPFIWFWPEGASSAAIMTHDVETTRGKRFTNTLMDIDDHFGIRASFQIVPERRYEVTPRYLRSITDRGFEIGVQDLNHDGCLYKNRKEFEERAARINAYGRDWGANGFRSAVLYRRQEWFDALEFSYDMSVPNVAHLDPQRGGCCTVMPYFIDRLLELPVTTTQDYSLFHILRDHSIDLWTRQIDLIMKRHGLISFIVHPDYITGHREQETYKALLRHLVHLRDEKKVWISTPKDVDNWWRQRANLTLVQKDGGWQIEGVGKERASLAHASEKDGRLELTVEPSIAESAIAKSVK